MREIYKKEIIFKAIEEMLQDRTRTCDFLYLLVKNKLRSIKIESDKLFEFYQEEYIPLIKENKGKNPDDYTISQDMVNKINKLSNKIENNNKQYEFYSELFKNRYNIDNDILLKRKERILKDIYKYLKLT